MSWNNKIIWSEGMFLQPQHFQQQDRFHESFVQNRTSPLFGNCWGFSKIEINQAALIEGKIQLLAGEGIFPDGTPFNFPNQDPPPEPLIIDLNLRDELIALVLPAQRIGTIETTAGNESDSNLARYKIAETNLVDSNTRELDQVPIQIGRLQMRLMRQQDVTGAYTALGVAHVYERRSDNQIVLQKTYIPPMLQVSTSQILAGYLQELCGMLHQRGNALASLISQPGHRGIAEIADFLMLQTINRYEPLFRHLSKTQILHPERLYSLCLNCAGDMSTFNESSLRRPIEYIEYQHDALAVCFNALMDELRRLLSLNPGSNVISIPLEAMQFGFRRAIVNDKMLFKSANFILAINAQLPVETIRSKSTNIKIGPAERIRDLVNLSLPGISLNPLPVAPREIPFHAGFNYFGLEQKNELWNQLEHSAGLMMHIGSELPGLVLELWAIKI